MNAKYSKCDHLIWVILEFSFNFGEIFRYPFVGNTGGDRVDKFSSSVYIQLLLDIDAPAPGMGHASGRVGHDGSLETIC